MLVLAQPGGPPGWVSVGQAVALLDTASDCLLKIGERPFKGGPQNRAHQCVFPLLLISGFGKKEAGLNKRGRLLRSIVLCCSDLCWVVLSQQIWQRAGQAKALRDPVPSGSK